MKTIRLLAAMLVLHAPVVAAQTSPAPPMDPRLIVALERPAAPAPAELRRDHWQGAWDGMVLGAVVGGLGFAAAVYFGNEAGSEGQDYALLALPVGGLVGGAVGLVGGAIIGAPDRDPAPRAELVVLPRADRGLTAALSVPVGTPR